MTVTRSQLLAEARSWLGTKFAHQGHLKGIACDCIGLIVESAKACGLITEFDYPAYARQPHRHEGGEIEKHLGAHMNRLGDASVLAQARAGDVVLIRWRAQPMHLAFLGDYLRHGSRGEPFSLIHAMLDIGKVAEHRLDETWRGRIVSLHRIPGLA